MIGGVQLAIPENELPLKLMVTGLSYHPAESGGLAVGVMVGLDTSTRKGTAEAFEEPSGHVTVQVSRVTESDA